MKVYIDGSGEKILIFIILITVFGLILVYNHNPSSKTIECCHKQGQPCEGYDRAYCVVQGDNYCSDYLPTCARGLCFYNCFDPPQDGDCTGRAHNCVCADVEPCDCEKDLCTSEGCKKVF